MTTISSLPLSLPLPRHYPCCCCYLRCCAADATAVSCANDAIIKGDNDDEGSAYNHRRRCPFKMSAKAASHLHTHLNGNLSQISSPPTHPSAAVHRQRPNIDKTRVSMTNAYEQTKHSIHGKQNVLFMWCQETPLLGNTNCAPRHWLTNSVNSSP